MHNGDLAKFVSLQNMCKKVLIDEANISKTVLMTLIFNARKNSRSRMHVKNCKKNCRGSLEISTFQMLLSSASKSVFHIRPMNYVSSFLKDYSHPCYHSFFTIYLLILFLSCWMFQSRLHHTQCEIYRKYKPRTLS